MLENVIIGAGPYGLSIAAHFRQRGIPFRIFGRPMDSWLNHMPKGMMLKSDGFASNIYDPDSEFTLKQFCSEQGIKYADSGIPVRLNTFSAYGLAFRDRLLPELEEKLVVSLDRAPEGFAVRLEDGETVTARRVVLAVGITHFEYLPENLAKLPPEFVSHSFRHANPEAFRERSCRWRRRIRDRFGGRAQRGRCRRSACRSAVGIEISQHAYGQAAFKMAADSSSAVRSGAGNAVALFF
jgi:cation diffusion facilitator CzcD-associated flavoprotein CzcO